ncbi:hypothetical protein [Methylobacterium sp. WSM2598]|uniref:hypothetical protein n=1 Tax=Methylobacterium sp. WSM2598 TaxID=398261 RepID=UPI0012F6C6AA|nr:hypothetical protein [Methylobacterium sp. WSM2598]
MVDVLERPSAEFEIAAAPQPPQRDVTLSIDVDLLDRLTERNLDAAEEINGLLRFYLDTTEAKAREFDLDAWEPGEMQEPPPAP